ncbi:MAG: Lipoprotein signal peptidase, partial [Petrotoga mobilis]
MNWVIPIIIFFDQLTKKLSQTFLLENNIKIGFFQLTYIENTGIAFGFFKDMALFHGTFSMLIVIFLFILKEKYKEKYKFFTTSFDLGISFI